MATITGSTDQIAKVIAAGIQHSLEEQVLKQLRADFEPMFKRAVQVACKGLTTNVMQHADLSTGMFRLRIDLNGVDLSPPDGAV